MLPRIASDRTCRARRFACAEQPLGELEELADRLALDREADHPRRLVDRANCCRRNQMPAAQEPGANGKGIGDIGLGAVHGLFHVADIAPLGVGDHKSLDATEVDGDSAHPDEPIRHP